MEVADEKLAYLSSKSISEIAFEPIIPNASHSWLNNASNDFERLIAVASQSTKSAVGKSQDRAIFKIYSRGLETHRDDWVYDYSEGALAARMKYFIAAYERARLKGDPAAEPSIKWDRELDKYLRRSVEIVFDERKIVPANYRPFTKSNVYYDPHVNAFLGQLPNIFVGTERPNPAVTIMGDSSGKPYFSLAVDQLPDLNFVSPASGGTQTLPRYRYTRDGLQQDNITDWALTQFTTRYGKAAAITKDDIFAYVYGVLHDPVYRETYALNLKREFPRIPLYPDFKRWRDWGQELLDLHIGYETVEPFKLTRVDKPDPKRAEGTTPAVKLKSDPDNGVIVLDAETQLTGAPRAAWDYRLGNRSAIDWVLDQHKEKTPKDPTVREKFNTYRFADHKEAVVDLLGRVTAVSLRTVEITEAMKGLPVTAREQKADIA